MGFFWLDSGQKCDLNLALNFFFSVLVQLLHKLSVRAADGPQKLLKVRCYHLLVGGRVLRTLGLIFFFSFR